MKMLTFIMLLYAANTNAYDWRGEMQQEQLRYEMRDNAYDQDRRLREIEYQQERIANQQARSYNNGAFGRQLVPSVEPTRIVVDPYAVPYSR